MKRKQGNVMPDSVGLPTPCRTHTHRVIQHTRHGIVIYHVTLPITIPWFA